MGRPVRRVNANSLRKRTFTASRLGWPSTAPSQKPSNDVDTESVFLKTVWLGENCFHKESKDRGRYITLFIIVWNRIIVNIIITTIVAYCPSPHYGNDNTDDDDDRVYHFYDDDDDDDADDDDNDDDDVEQA